MKLNLNDLAKAVAASEGLKQEVNIAQIKEVIRVLCRLLYARPLYVVAMVQNGAKQCATTK